MQTPSSPRPKPLLYADYINDRAVVEALRLPAATPIGVNDADWPQPPAHWQAGDDWPSDSPWNHDEVLFIRTHQAFEVWFALIIHELGSVLREASALWAAHGSSIPRLELDHRRDDDAPGFDPNKFPAIARVAAAAADADPEARQALNAVNAPGRLFQDPGLPLAALARPELIATLARWTARVERARQALLCTLPFFDVLTTLTPAQFLIFRDRLQPASGFGSGQFRELELTLGLRELNRHKIAPPGGSPDPAPGEEPLPRGLLRPTEHTPAPLRFQSFHYALPRWQQARVAARYAAPSLRDLAYALLNAAYLWRNDPAYPTTGRVFDLPDLTAARIDAFAARALDGAIADGYRGLSPRALDASARERLTDAIRSLDRAMAHRETIVAALFEMELDHSPLATFLHTCLALDAAVLRWRDHHIRFVEQQIGMRRGTGGGGIAYLRTTTAAEKAPHLTHAFPALWQARSFVQRPI
jgi:tryptophan 2,3-dioxygenase